MYRRFDDENWLDIENRGIKLTCIIVEGLNWHNLLLMFQIELYPIVGGANL